MRPNKKNIRALSKDHKRTKLKARFLKKVPRQEELHTALSCLDMASDDAAEHLNEEETQDPAQRNFRNFLDNSNFDTP